MMRKGAKTLGLALLLGSTGSLAAVPNSGSLLDLDLGQLMELPVVTASRHEQAQDRAPAVITVLDGEDLRRHGYHSVAEALRRVPGFYVISDGVGEYVVVRGIDSGERAWGRTLKLMLDGQPLGIRSNGNQSLGPELIPMTAIERIEVVRGPASAIYGADAYLGVINIITRNEAPSAQLDLRAGRMSEAGTSVGGEALSSFRHGPWSALVTGALARDNRSGLSLPTSSPRFAAFADPRSRDDISHPSSAYLRLRHDAGADLRHTLALHASEQDSDAQFLNFGTLQQDNRVAQEQHTVSWLSEWEATPEQRYQLRLAHAWGGPADDQRLDLGQSSSYPLSEFGYRSTELGLEGQFLRNRHHLVVGMDGRWDHESPFEVFSVDRSTGNTTLLSQPQSGHLFRDLGGYVQYQWLPEDGGWSPSLNWRHDHSNQYGGHDSYRAGLARELLPRLRAKLLYGSSYKAPNAYELFAVPLFTGDTLGNPGLVPETASSTDLQLIWQAQDNLLLSVTAYHLHVRNLIKLQPFGFNQRWTNIGKEKGTGVETELRWRHGPHEFLLNNSWADTTVRQEQPLTPSFEVQTASAPRLVTTGEWCWRQDSLEFGIASIYASDRRASDSNIDANLKQVYVQPAYTTWRLHALKDWRAHRLSLVLDNALDREYAEPGYGGIDLPARRRTLWLGWSWQFREGS